GLSLSYLVRNFETRQPASIRVCALLVKQRARPVEIKLDYVGREIADAFVVGYGLDAGERHRNLPYIARLPSRGPEPPRARVARPRPGASPPAAPRPARPARGESPRGGRTHARPPCAGARARWRRPA